MAGGLWRRDETHQPGINMPPLAVIWIFGLYAKARQKGHGARCWRCRPRGRGNGYSRVRHNPFDVRHFARKHISDGLPSKAGVSEALQTVKCSYVSILHRLGVGET